MHTGKPEIKISGQGKGWVCVEKPAGISVHNDPGQDIISLMASNPVLASHINKGPNTFVQPVHRLDKETSGLLLLATGPETLTRLSGLFADGKVKKTYLALVHGHLKKNKGMWSFPLSKEAGGRNHPAGRGKKVRAQTRYMVLEQTPHYTLLEIEPLTGRKHQIRRHAKLAGHPLTGDSRYGSKRAVAFLSEHMDFHRLGLHSLCLGFKDGDNQVRLTSQHPPLEMERLLNQDFAG